MAESANGGVSLVSALRQRAMQHPTSEAIRFLERGDVDGPQQVLHYAELDRRARAWAALLQRRAAELDQPLLGERILLLHPQGIDLVVALFACMYAGAVPVVCPNPPRANLRRKLDRLRGIFSDCAPRWILGNADLMSRKEDLLEHAAELARAQWLATNDDPPADATSWIEPAFSGASLAFLQYSSGSTGTPKGVMVSHANMLAQAAMGAATMGTSRSSAVIWTPLFHDMGLATLLYVLLYGGRVILFSATSFAQRPARWLEAIDRFRADRSGAPNFAYEMCVDHVSPSERTGLDLSCWKVAFCGAEPVRASTLRRFAEAFAGCGLSEAALAPAYGLAESTCLVTISSHRRTAPRVLSVARAALEEHGRAQLAPVRNGSAAAELVSVGGSIDPQRLRIVDPETCMAVRDGAIGEIWIQGPCVGRGYWGREEESRRTFRAALAEEPGTWLRTGDLGALQDGELYVTGRLKDLIVIRGRNFFPQDLEHAAARAAAGLQPDGVAAVSVDTAVSEELAIIAEVSHACLRSRAEVSPYPRIIDGIQRELADRFQIVPLTIVLIRPGELLRTTSGKVRRAELRRALIDQALQPLYVWNRADRSIATGTLNAALLKAAELGDDLVPCILEFLAEQLQDDVRMLEDSPLADIPMESLRLISLRARIELELDIQLPTERLFDLWQHVSVHDLAQELATRWLDRYLARALSPSTVASFASSASSPTQLTL